MKQPYRTLTGQRQRGATLIEAATVLMVVAAVSGLVGPSFQQARERMHLEGAAAQLETDLQFARSAAVARNAGLRVSFETRDDGHSCYVVHSGSAGDCSCASGAPVCQPGAEALRSVHFGPDLPLRVVSNSRSILFDPVRGTVTPTATLRVQAAGGAALHQVVNVMGRIRTCSPAPALRGYRAC